MFRDKPKGPVLGLFNDEATPDNILSLCVQAQREVENKKAVIDEINARYRASIEGINARYRAELEPEKEALAKLSLVYASLETYRKTHGSVKPPKLVETYDERYNPETRRFQSILKFRGERWNDYTRRIERYYEYLYEYRDPETQQVWLSGTRPDAAVNIIDPEDCDFI